MKPRHLPAGQHPLLFETPHSLLGRSQLLETLEDELDGTPDVHVGVLHDPSVFEADEAGG
jgi:hypothetical protein